MSVEASVETPVETSVESVVTEPGTDTAKEVTPEMSFQTDIDALRKTRNEELMRIKRQETIAFVCRQTPYTPEEAEAKLYEYRGDYMRLISDTFKSMKKPNPGRREPTTTNQQIYSQIRGFMDTSARQFEARKRQSEMLQRLAQAQAQAQTQSPESTS